MFEADPDQKPMKPSRPSLIPTGDELQEKQEESFVVSLGKLVSNAWDSVMEILRKKQTDTSYQQYNGTTKQSAAFSTTTPWPIQESFVIRDEDEPPPVEPRNPTPRKTYAFMSKDPEKMQQLRQSRAFYSSWDAEFPNQQQQQQQKQHQKHQHQQQHRRHYSSIPHTYYEKDSEKTNEIVFGAVQEQSSKRVAKPKPIESEDQMNNNNTQQNLHYRAHSVSYPYGYYPYT